MVPPESAPASAWRVFAGPGPRRPVELPAAPGQSLLQALYLAGLAPAGGICAGLGRCGRCRVRFLDDPPAPLASELAVLGETAVQAGWRLACLRPAGSEPWVVSADREAGEVGEQGESKTKPPVREIALGWEPPDPDLPDLPLPRRAPKGDLRLAVDLGTTSVAYAGLGPEGVFFRGQTLNPQLPAGSEIMSRLAWAREGHGATLRHAAQGLLARLAAGVSRAGSADAEMLDVVLAGNPAMIALALGKDVTGLSVAPYRLDHRGGEYVALPGLPPVWIVPHASAFVGGDVMAGLLWLLDRSADSDGGPPPFPFLLADMGTNGEFVLALSPSELLAASVPMGPALEGAGLRCGTLAGPGVVTRFTLSPATPSGLLAHLFDEGAVEPHEIAGVSGTGFLSLVRLLRTLGVLDGQGRFVSGGRLATPLAKRVAEGLERDAAGRPVLQLPGHQLLAAEDVEELMKVRAAFRTAVELLLDAAGLAPDGLARLVLAGALGRHADPADLAGLGFIPAAWQAPGRWEAPGNTSLAGAELLAARPDLRPACVALAHSVQSLDLAAAPDFAEAYLAHMRLDDEP